MNHFYFYTMTFSEEKLISSACFDQLQSQFHFTITSSGGLEQQGVKKNAGILYYSINSTRQSPCCLPSPSRSFAAGTNTRVPPHLSPWLGSGWAASFWSCLMTWALCHGPSAPTSLSVHSRVGGRAPRRNTAWPPQSSSLGLNKKPKNWHVRYSSHIFPSGPVQDFQS